MSTPTATPSSYPQSILPTNHTNSPTPTITIIPTIINIPAKTFVENPARLKNKTGESEEKTPNVCKIMKLFASNPKYFLLNTENIIICLSYPKNYTPASSKILHNILNQILLGYLSAII